MSKIASQEEKIQYTKKGSKGSVKFVNVDKNQFFATLKKRVDDYFVTNNITRYGNTTLVIKTIALAILYVGPFLALLFLQPGMGISMLLWTVMGIGLAGMGMSVMHDGNHGSYSSNKTTNYLMAHTLNFMGGSTMNWKLQHNILHHTYTNIEHMDDDIAPKPALRLSPHSAPSKYAKYQWIHGFFLYGLTTLFWVTAKDFMQYVRYRKNGVNTANQAESRIILAKMILLKIIYFAAFFGIPVLMFNIPFMQVLTGFLWMHFLAGVVLSTIFQLAHTLEGTCHPLPDERGIVENDWAIHQMNTTMNFARHNKLLSWYVGGLNFQVEHHLFPRISHVHYPAIAPIVKQTAEEFNIPYLEHRTFGEAFQAHVRFLKKLGRLPDIGEAIA